MQRGAVTLRAAAPRTCGAAAAQRGSTPSCARLPAAAPAPRRAVLALRGAAASQLSLAPRREPLATRLALPVAAPAPLASPPPLSRCAELPQRACDPRRDVTSLRCVALRPRAYRRRPLTHLTRRSAATHARQAAAGRRCLGRTLRAGGGAGGCCAAAACFARVCRRGCVRRGARFLPQWRFCTCAHAAHRSRRRVRHRLPERFRRGAPAPLRLRASRGKC